MSDYMISIPDELYEKARRVAEQTSRQVEEVIRTRLEDALDSPVYDLPDDETAELKAMACLSDDALFGMMREQMQRTKQERMSGLIDKNSDGAISEAEYQELTALVEDGQRLMLRKAQAMRYLMDRGHKVTLENLDASQPQERHVQT